MKGIVRLDSLTIDEREIRITFKTEGLISQAFRSHEFTVEYSEAIGSVPESIAVIPFVANVLPIIWVYDAELVVRELDKDFFDNITNIKTGYENMYPEVAFGGQVTVGSLVRNRVRSKQRNTALFFSGGADATSSLITMLKNGDKPHLFTLWGADVRLADVDGWHEKYSHTERVAHIFNLESSSVKTNFRTFINEYLLDKKIERKAGDKWWHGFQHGIGIISHIAPLTFLYGFHESHIAASFVAGDNMPCASDPTIDEHVHIADSKTIHNGYDLTRQNKIRNIQSYISQLEEIHHLPIKVCLASRDSKNCGRCEKCMRTACGILAEGGSVDFYGLEKFDAQFTKQYLTNVHYFRHTLHWQQIQNRLRENRAKIDSKPSRNISWLLDTDLGTINNHLPKKIKYYIRTVARPVARVMPYRLKLMTKKLLKM